MSPKALFESMQPVLRLPTCVLGVRINTDGLIEEVRFLPPETETVAVIDPTRTFVSMMEAYLEHPRALADNADELPTTRSGTEFQNRVWAAIRAVPCGETITYGNIATQLQSSARAVGQACGANPLPILTPCHRILAQSGLGGFAGARDGWLIATKIWLLRHEMNYRAFP